MDPKQVARQMIAFNKTTFDNNFHAMQAVHEQTVKLMNRFWEKTPMFPEQGKQAINGFLDAYKKGSADFKNMVDENFKKAEDYFSESQ